MSSKIIIKQQIVKRGIAVVFGVMLVAVVEEDSYCISAVVFGRVSVRPLGGDLDYLI